MADRDQLIALLRRVQWRSRAQGGLEGGIVGAALGVAGITVERGLERWLGAASGWSGSVALAGAAAGLGALLGAWRRRAALATCARSVDDAIARAQGSGEPRNGDRIFVALALREQGPSPFAEAALRDALRSATSTSPAAAAPWRRPRGLSALGVVTMALFGVAAWPERSRAGRRAPLATPTSRAERAWLGRAEVATAAAAVVEAERRAGALGDAELGRLADEVRRLLSALDAGSLTEREALGRLSELEEKARADEREGAALRGALDRAGATLAADPLGRQLGTAMRAMAGEAARQALEQLAGAVGAAPAARRQKLAEALGRAAAAARGPDDRAAGAAGATGPEQPRRLGQEARRPAEGAKDEARSQQEASRQLRRLERDLQDEADACRSDPTACQQSLRRGAEGAEEQAQAGQRARARQQLSRGLEALRDRLQQGGRGGGERGAAEQRFEQAARGGGAKGSAGPGEGAAGPTSATGAAAGAGQPDATERAGGTARAGEAGATSAAGPPAQGAAGPRTPGAAGARTPGEAGAQSAAASGNGAGDRAGAQAGDDPLGGRASAEPAAGHRIEARVADADDSSRAQAIEAGARQGFARQSYQRLYRDYEAAVEETLDATAVPPGRRRLVRRYFELIRPR